MYFIFVMYYVIKYLDTNSDNYSDMIFVRTGILFGVFKLFFPMIYDLLFPIILVLRKTELRERYANICRNFLRYFVPSTL